MTGDRDLLVILTDEDFELDDEGKGWDEPIRNAVGRLRPVKLDPEIVQEQMVKFVRTVGRVFQQANAEVSPESGLRLEEVELSIKINGKGQVQLIAGGEAGAEAGITLKFKRSPKGNGWWWLSMANNWAIVAGINTYDFLPGSPLKFAVADTIAMRSSLCDEVGFKSDQVLFCGDGTDGSKRAIKSVLRDILLYQIQRAKNADNLWFFFSGHGIAEHLMPIDGNPRDLKETAISIQFVTDCLRNCNAKNVVLVLDMCRSESRDADERTVESIEGSLRELVKQREGQQGIITLFSCGRGESSYEVQDLGQGAFTYALLEGLRTTTIVKDLERHLAERVPELHRIHASEKRRKQVPLVIPEPGWKYDEPILSSHVTAADVGRLKERAKDAEIEEQFDEAKRLLRQIVELSDLKLHRMDALRAIDRVDGKIARLQSSLITEDEDGTAPITESQEGKNDWNNIDFDKGIDFTKLESLLKDQRWKDADQETYRLMCQVIGKYIQVKDLRVYPQDAIEKIDALWSKASNEKFGFLIQARIWKNLNGDESKFDIKVGWKHPDANKQKKYSQIEFDLESAEIGQFPAFFKSWGGGGWSWTNYLLNRVSEFLEPIDSIHPLDAISLDSEKGVDYRKLRDMLRVGYWQRADRETLQLMLKVANRESNGFLNSESLKKFPCKDLKTIDQLWVTASNGRFGFSVQKKIWQEWGSPTSSSRTWGLFCVRVGWAKHSTRWWENKNFIFYVNYSDLRFDLSVSPKGHLPLVGVDGVLVGNKWVWSREPGSLEGGSWGVLFSHMENCEPE